MSEEEQNGRLIIDSTLSAITVYDVNIAEKAQARLDNLTKPKDSLGRLEELAKQIAAITGKLNPDLEAKLVIIMAADHGVTEEGVSAYPSEVTPQMVYNFLNGGAGINVLARHTGADVVIVDAGVAEDIRAEELILQKKNNTENISGSDVKKSISSGKKIMFINKKVAKGTMNMARQAAMTPSQAIRCIASGINIAREMIESGYGIIGTGDMGIGNTTASSAIAACICGASPEEVTGYGTGIDEAGYKKKVEVIKKAIQLNKPDPLDGIDVLSKVGGFEIGGIAGVILGCASKRIPVVIDGFISGAGALIAQSLCPASRDYMIASHSSVEIGHKIMLEKLSLKPLFNFGMRLGEGTGAAIGINISEAAIKILNEMATFNQAGVSQKNE